MGTAMLVSSLLTSTRSKHMSLRRIRCGATRGAVRGAAMPCHALPCYDQRQAVGSWAALATPPRGASEIRALDGASVLPGVRGRIRPCG
jgi:hypothetical protein